MLELVPMCRKCGETLPDNARFCPRCGSAVAAGKASAATDPPRTGQPSETAEFLGKLAIFEHVETAVLDGLADEMNLISYPEGPIFSEGDPVDGLYIIRSGAVKVTKSAEAGGPAAVLNILGRGDSCGEIGLIDGMPRSAGVEAMRPTECYFLERERFVEALAQHPEIARGMLQALARMVRSADAWVASKI